MTKLFFSSDKIIPKFSVDSPKYDFWPIYNTIKHFYPIHPEKDDSKSTDVQSQSVALQSLIQENIHNDQYFNERWVSFTEQLERVLGNKIIGTTYGRAPSYSSYVLVEKSELSNLTRTKELHFFVSLLGPYYTIVGRDGNSVCLDELLFTSTNYLIASPENEFSSAFHAIIEKIEREFAGYRFVPFMTCLQSIEGLVCYEDQQQNTVFHALFSDYLRIMKLPIIGDIFYKSEGWLKEEN